MEILCPCVMILILAHVTCCCVRKLVILCVFKWHYHVKHMEKVTHYDAKPGSSGAMHARKRENAHAHMQMSTCVHEKL